MKKTTDIPIGKIELNNGQIEGLPKNPRFIRDERYKSLVKSIQDAPEMLELRELLVYPHGGKYVVIGGNMRLRACRELKHKEIPCKVLDENTPAEKLREYAMKDNIAFGDTDWDIIANEWDVDELSDWGVEFPTDFELPGEGGGNHADEDDFDEDTDNVEARTEKGDVWQLGEHRLMCGDSTSEEDVAKLMGDDVADLLLTDPPYNVNYEENVNRLKEIEANNREVSRIANDKMSDKNFVEFLTSVFTAAMKYTKPGGCFYIWSADKSFFQFLQAADKARMRMRQIFIWNKSQFTLGLSDYQSKHEPCIYGWKDGAAHNWYSDRKQSTVFDFEKPRRSEDHPTMKPVGLFGYQMSNSSKAGDIVLDIFGGSGTTMIAAEQLNRKSRLMEIDPHYCDVIIARWEKMTNQKAERIERYERKELDSVL